MDLCISILTLIYMFVFVTHLQHVYTTWVVIRVVDGDTVHVAKRLLGIVLVKRVVRLKDVWCPELSHPKTSLPSGQDVRKRVEALLKSKRVTIKWYGKGKYGRHIAILFMLNGNCVNHWIVNNKLGFREYKEQEAWKIKYRLKK